MFCLFYFQQLDFTHQDGRAAASCSVIHMSVEDDGKSKKAMGIFLNKPWQIEIVETLTFTFKGCRNPAIKIIAGIVFCSLLLKGWLAMKRLSCRRSHRMRVRETFLLQTSSLRTKMKSWT